MSGRVTLVSRVSAILARRGAVVPLVPVPVPTVPGTVPVSLPVVVPVPAPVVVVIRPAGLAVPWGHHLDLYIRRCRDLTRMIQIRFENAIN